jgi:hypothetical protein
MKVHGSFFRTALAVGLIGHAAVHAILPFEGFLEYVPATGCLTVYSLTILAGLLPSPRFCGCSTPPSVSFRQTNARPLRESCHKHLRRSHHRQCHFSNCPAA